MTISSYNAIGNIISVNGNQYSYSGIGKTNPHAVTKIGFNNYTYNENGNLTLSQENGCAIFNNGSGLPQLNLNPNPPCENSNVWNLEKEFYYNWQNQPVVIVIGYRTAVTNAYDETGNRFLYQTFNTSEIQIENNCLLRNGIPEINIKLNDVSVGLVSNGVIYSTVTDHLGSSVKQVNFSGIIAEDTTYDSFGAVLSHTGMINAKEGYTGHQEDDDTGLVYAGARYYNPSIGKFLSQDPVFLALGNAEQVKSLTGSQLQNVLSDPQGLNSYAYARNNPLRLVDPNGQWFWDLVTGKQSWNDFQVEVGDAANILYDTSPAWKVAMDHPIATGAVVGVVGGVAAAGGAAGVTALSTKYLGGVGTACVIACSTVVQKANTFNPVAQQNQWLDGVTNTSAQNVFKDVFRAQDRIPGGTIEAIRREVSTGQLTGGKSHLTKGWETVNRINNILNSEKLNPMEYNKLNDVRRQIEKALTQKWK